MIEVPTATSTENGKANLLLHAMIIFILPSQTVSLVCDARISVPRCIDDFRWLSI